MTPPIFSVGAAGVDTERLVREIQETVERKRAEGAYADPLIARAEKSNLMNLRNEEDFLKFFLTTLGEAAIVDINDFEIRERRSALAPLLIALKKVIWKLLKFYTYRLWSQQNLVNGLMVTGMESIDEKYTERIARLEARIAELERKLGSTKVAG